MMWPRFKPNCVVWRSTVSDGSWGSCSQTKEVQKEDCETPLQREKLSQLLHTIKKSDQGHFVSEAVLRYLNIDRVTLCWRYVLITFLV